MSRSAADALVETLVKQGVDRAFCVPGESYIAVLDSLVDETAIQVVTCRHESGAGFMALADAKITGRAGTCFVSRGPGATNASIAVHTADQDAVPVVFFIGQIERKDFGRGAFQEVDYAKTFSDMAKAVEEVHDPERLPEVAARAYHIAESGTPGPVIVSLPEDMLEQPCAAPAQASRPRPRPLPAEADVSTVADLLAEAKRPVLIAGGMLGQPAARKSLLACSEAWSLAVAPSFKRQDLFPNEHPNYAGHLGYGIPPALGEALAEADLVLAVGTRLGDITTQGYTLPKPEQALVHVYPDAAAIGAVFPATHAMVADAGAFVAALAERNAPPAPAGRADWNARLHAIHAGLAAWTPLDATDGVDFGHVVRPLVDRLGDDAILITDAGNFSSWLHRHYPFKETNLLLGAVTGAMGLGVPAAVAAALREPGRQVVALIGDGGFLMTGNELATAVKEGARICLIVSNNGAYGTIRLHQEKKFPGRTIATDLSNPDFAALAQAFGATGLTIETPDQAAGVIDQALAADGPVVVDVRSSLDHISAYATVAGLRGH